MPWIFFWFPLMCVYWFVPSWCSGTIKYDNPPRVSQDQYHLTEELNDSFPFICHRKETLFILSSSSIFLIHTSKQGRELTLNKLNEAQFTSYPSLKKKKCSKYTKNYPMHVPFPTSFKVKLGIYLRQRDSFIRSELSSAEYRIVF